ncbi:ABC transporter permease [Indioceanicola profundi]|uniref:ABC transporter permease n=1 Tax=Indioceanicola profundi TaxID=2220096 RepID=UPI000E6ADC05|nr:ABC transporter permease [Indioceanicola profundi]
MLRNWITVTLRNLARHRLYAAVNILGLAVGLAACLLIAVLVRHETSFDGFHANADRIVRVNRTEFIAERAPQTSGTTAMPVGPTLADAYPEVEMMVRVARFGAIIQTDGGVFRERVFRTDPGYFQLIDAVFLHGDASLALAERDSAVLTQSKARKYFGDVDPVGRTLTLTTGRSWRITGVIADPPVNTRFDAGIITHLDSSFSDSADQWYRERVDGWSNHWLTTYLLLRPGADLAAMQARMEDVLAETPDYQRPDTPGLGYSFTLSFQPLAEINTNPQGGEPGTPTTVIHALIAVGGLILLVAGINFVNLTTARASLRAREVAVRKTLGARRASIIAQFLGESVMLSLFAGLVALALVELSLPLVLQGLELPALAGPAESLELLTYALPFLVLLGVAAGLYPAFILSAFAPASALKGGGTAPGGGKLRTVLVVVQFGIAIALVIGTTVILTQTRYASSQRLGFDQENLVLLRGLDLDEVRPQREALIERIGRLPGVVTAGLTSWAPADPSERTTTFRFPGEERAVTLRNEPVDFGYLEALGARLLAGRIFDRARPVDLFQESGQTNGRFDGTAVVTAGILPVLGVATPEEALGRPMIYGSTVTDGVERHHIVTIVGVVEDIQFSSARDALVPTVFMVDRTQLDVLAIRLAASTGPDTLAAIDAMWRDVVPNVPVRRDFLDERVRRLYAAEARQATVLAAFAGLTIVIACLGLFGLAAFTAERRTKEIGVRKVLGARTRDIVRLLVWQFSRPVLLANLIAWPVAWIAMEHWLNGFAIRIDLGPGPFLAAGAGALVIAWATVAGHAARVARRRPVTALRYE